ncbi:MAG: hypothetical protein KDB07_04330 [Planctomycetes bacterium]|nr:hypothetical protein [Planctomycetota bacterium]
MRNKAMVEKAAQRDFEMFCKHAGLDPYVLVQACQAKQVDPWDAVSMILGPEKISALLPFSSARQMSKAVAGAISPAAAAAKSPSLMSRMKNSLSSSQAKINREIKGQATGATAKVPGKPTMPEAPKQPSKVTQPKQPKAPKAPNAQEHSGKPQTQVTEQQPSWAERLDPDRKFRDTLEGAGRFARSAAMPAAIGGGLIYGGHKIMQARDNSGGQYATYMPAGYGYQ